MRSRRRPAVLAAAQDRHVDDAALLTAFVAGSEVAYTLADIAGQGWAPELFETTGGTPEALKDFILGLGRRAGLSVEIGFKDEVQR